MVVVPVTDAKGQTQQATAPDGQSYPVFKAAEDSPLVRRITDILTTTFAHQALKLDRYARNLLMWELAEQGREGTDQYQRLTEPMYLLLSNEEGGFARFGFWLQDQRGARRLVLASYVDLVVDEGSLERGNFEEIFPHELGHTILRALVGEIADGPSRKMHMSMTVTDYPTAFDEGYAEHFQPLVRDATKNAYLLQLMRGATPTDLSAVWHSRIDQQLRTEGVKRNLFIYQKALPASALEPNPDRYQLYLDSETSAAFLIDSFKNAQQMMACEGVIATLCYRLVNDERLRSHYREAEFYRRFIPSQQATAAPQQLFNPYENVNLKLFVALRQMSKKPLDGRRPLMIEIVQTYSKLFPDEAEAIYDVFLKTIHGVTVSQEAAITFQRLAHTGRIGDVTEFRRLLPAARELQSKFLQDVKSGRAGLDSNLGPELWLLHSDFKIAQAVWVRERKVPFTLNLNTATEAELMTLPGVDLAVARRIVAARNSQGFFRSLDDLRQVEGVPAPLMRSLQAMSESMKQAGE
ncbi:MAG: helix-hairpin-helix domain-containing protein [Acidobacteria bacterium]|nr:helix-hairpin-helix domain-containing protein [Acidobacteriota bacterium]